ncbi:MAG: tetratricopeptide repeat protein [Balneolaceae bacterium]
MSPIKFLFLVTFLSLFVVFYSLRKDSTSLPEGVEAISLLGDSLTSDNTSLPENLTLRIDSLINVANTKGETSTALIWEARLLGYNGQYREAIDLLTSGLDEMEGLNRAEILRHRGHRFISIREFEKAILDFEEASELIEGTDDIVEQDGLPNASNFPTSSLHTNIWYHLGLAYYVTGEFEKAQFAYQQCIKASTNDDMLVAALYWQYMTLKRNGQDELAGKILNGVHSEMDIIENDSYLKLLLVFKAEFDPQLLIDESSDALSNATIGYGIGNWHFINDRKERAQSIWEQVYEGKSWASFGYIASEVELARLYE